MEKIAIIGIGRLGLCLALNLEKVGYTVLGIDVSQIHVDNINQKTLESNEPHVIEYLAQSTNFKASVDFQEIFEKDFNLIFIVLPTPSLPSGEFSHEYINAIIETLANKGKQTTTKHIIINSTCMPGYCNSIEQKLSALNYTLTYNPEFIAQGSIIKDQQYPDQVLIGETNTEVGDMIQNVYKKLCKNTPRYCRMSLLSAEITKLATNCFLTTKISFANAIGDISAKVGAEPEKILEAIGADSRIGNAYFKYGFGYGGPCFPRDNKAFIQFAEKSNCDMLISKATDKANQLHTNFLFEQYKTKYKNEPQIIFDSVTYKKGTDILEESQQLKLAVLLANAGHKVVIKESASVIKMLIDSYANLFTYQVNE
jgi:UDPglucose 6-dehydrogenase